MPLPEDDTSQHEKNKTALEKIMTETEDTDEGGKENNDNNNNNNNDNNNNDGSNDNEHEATDNNSSDHEDIEIEVPSYSSFIPPDGGYGWVVVLGAFAVQFFVLGTMNNFGILFTQLLNDFHSSKQETSWVGSITYGLMFLTGPISTSVAERIGCRTVAIIGAFIGMAGTLLASFSDSIFKMYLTQGLLFGIGASLCYFPSVIILPQYFFKHLSLANGLVSCGSGVGTMAMAPIINYVIKTYGWRNSIRVSTCLLFLCSIISLLYRPNKHLQKLLKERRKQSRPPLFDLSVFRNKGFLVLTFALFVFMLSYFVPFVHLTQMALEYDIEMENASLLIGFMSVASTFGRLFFGKIADNKCINRLFMFQISLLGMGVANTICPLLKSFGGLLVYCTIFGFFEGCYVCQVPVIVGDIVGIDRMAVSIGILFGVNSVPLTLGPPLAGFLYDVSDSYQVAFYVAGAIPIISSVIIFAVPFLIPPKDDPFWRHHPPSSGQQLLHESSAESCTAQDYKNNNIVGKTEDQDSCKPHQKFLLATKETLSFSSTGSFHLVPMDRRISMRELGSVSSFGSVISSPVQNNNILQNLLVVDRVTNL